MSSSSMPPPGQPGNPLALAQLLHDWAERRERGTHRLDPDAVLARRMMEEALELEEDALDPMTELQMARWKISWLSLSRRARWLLSAPPSKRTRRTQRPLSLLDAGHIQTALRRKLWPTREAA